MKVYAKRIKIIECVFLSIAIITALASFAGIFSYSQIPDDLAVPLMFLTYLSFLISAGLFCKRIGSAVAYDQVAWIYSTGGRLGGYIIRLKNGKKAYIMISNSQEFFSLLNNYIAPQNPDKIIEGKTIQTQKEFLRLYPEAARSFTKGKIIGGSILSVYALLGIVFGLVNDTLDTGSIIVVGVIEAIGLGILLFGLKDI